jgi:hypothetical protein
MAQDPAELEDHGVYMHQGGVNRAYMNLTSCQLVQWQSGLYVIRARADGSVYLQFLVDLALDFGATENPLQFAEPAGATVVVLSKKIATRAYCTKVKMIAPEFVLEALAATRPTGFSREYRLRHGEYRKLHEMPAQPIPVFQIMVDVGEDDTVVDDSPGLTEILDEDQLVRQTAFRRGTLSSALSHKHPKCSRDMWRASAYMDDFDIAVVDQPSQKRVKYTRQCLKDTGAEVKFPFGDEKWAEGEPSQDMASLGIGFDVTDPLQPRAYTSQGLT